MRNWTGSRASLGSRAGSDLNWTSLRNWSESGSGGGCLVTLGNVEQVLKSVVTDWGGSGRRASLDCRSGSLGISSKVGEGCGVVHDRVKLRVGEDARLNWSGGLGWLSSKGLTGLRWLSSEGLTGLFYWSLRSWHSPSGSGNFIIGQLDAGSLTESFTWIHGVFYIVVSTEILKIIFTVCSDFAGKS